MNFKIGDFVRFVDEAIEGYITSFGKDDLVGVTDDSGFEIPVLKSKITKVHEDTKAIEKKEFIESAKLEEASSQFVEKGIFTVVIPDLETEQASLQIMNETSFELLVSISLLEGKYSTGLLHTVIPAHSALPFFSNNLKKISKWPTFDIQIIKYSGLKAETQEPLAKKIKIQPIEISDRPKTISFLNAKGWVFALDNEKELELDKLKSNFMSHRPIKK